MVPHVLNTSYLRSRLSSSGVPTHLPAFCEAQASRPDAALALLEKMERLGLRPDVYSYATAMRACGRLRTHWSTSLVLKSKLVDSGYLLLTTYDLRPTT